jgi:dihydrofolate reductase
MNVIVYLASSVNGMISNQRNVPDWLSPEYGEGFMSITHRTKAVIMGKKTYQILAPDHLPLKDEGSLIVLAHDRNPPAQSNVIFTDKSPQEIISLLKSRGHTEAVIIGGTATVSEFFKSGLVNELYLVVEPVLFDSGLPLLKSVNIDFKLNLAGVKQLNENTVELHYKVAV